MHTTLGVLTVFLFFFFGPRGNPNFTVYLLTGLDTLFRIFLPQFPFGKMEIILVIPYKTVRLLRQVNIESTSRIAHGSPCKGLLILVFHYDSCLPFVRLIVLNPLVPFVCSLSLD